MPAKGRSERGAAAARTSSALDSGPLEGRGGTNRHRLHSRRPGYVWAARIALRRAAGLAGCSSRCACASSYLRVSLLLTSSGARIGQNPNVAVRGPDSTQTRVTKSLSRAAWHALGPHHVRDRPSPVNQGRAAAMAVAVLDSVGPAGSYSP